MVAVVRPHSSDRTAQIRKQPQRIIGAVVAQPLRQPGLGLFAGAFLVAFLSGMMKGSAQSANQLVMPGGYMALMTAVCMIACVVPTRRALSVDPAEALRAY